MSFDTATRRTIIALPPITKATGASGPTAFNLPKSGLLSRLWLDATGAITSGGLSAQNAQGFGAAFRRTRLTMNSGQDLWNLSGPGYHFGFRNFHNIYFDPVPMSSGRTAITATTYDVSEVMEFQLNQSDPLGLIVLQNEQTLATLVVEFEADATMATGITTNTMTVNPYLEFFTVPTSPDDWPPLNIVHQVLEDQVSISGAGQQTYYWPRGNTYLQMIHMFGQLATSPVDGATNLYVRVNQSLYFYNNIQPKYLSMEYAMNHPAQRLVGTYAIDLLGNDGLGAFGKSRDFINSAALTDLATVFTADQARTLYSIRRQLVPLLAA
jgi:hypothetical protein